MFKMAKMTTIIGPVNSGKTADVLQIAAERLNTGSSVYFLLPSNHHLRHIKQSLMRMVRKTAPGQVIFGTFLSWAEWIVNLAGKAYQQTSGAEEWLNIFSRLSKQANGSLQSGTVSLLQKMFADFRETGIDDKEMFSLLGKLGNDRITNWFHIYEDIRRQSEENRRVTSSELILRAYECLKNRESLLNGDLLIVDGFYEFTPIQRKILMKLSNSFREILITAVYEPSHDVYRYCRNSTAFLGDVNVINKTISKPSAFDSIQMNLFKEGCTLSLPDELVEPSEFSNTWDDTNLKIVECPSRWREVETAARTIKRWALDGMQLEKIGIVYRGLYNYAKMISLIFPQYGVPVAKNDEIVFESEPAQLLLRIISVNEKHFTRTEMLDLLRLDCVQNRYGKDIVADLERLTAELGVPFRKQDWLEQFENRLDYLHWRKSLVIDDDEFERVVINDSEEKMERIRPVLHQILDDITLPASATWLNYQKIFETGLNCFFPSLSDSVHQEAVHQICKIMQIMTRLAGSEDKVFLSDYAQTLKKFLESSKYREENVTQEKGIYFSDIMNARGMAFDGLILLGMIDGEFPEIRREDPLLNNELRRRLNEFAGEQILPETAVNIDEEKLLFYLTVTSVSQKLLITYPASGINGSLLPVSPFVHDLIASIDREQVKFEIITASEVLPKFTEIASNQDIQCVFSSKGYLNAEPNSVIKDFIDVRSIRILCEMISVERIRHSHQKSDYNGCLSDKGIFTNLLHKEFSVSRIQEYAQCPFAYLCKNVWKIFVPEEPSMDLTPLVDGLMIHEALETLLRIYLIKGVNYKEFLETMATSLIDIVVEKINLAYRAKFKFLSTGVWKKRMEILKLGLEAFIHEELNYTDKSYHPQFLEEKFTFNNKAFLFNTGDQTQEVRFLGKIDRIDVNPALPAIMVVEYKRTAASVFDPKSGVEKGIHFQLPLYLLAAQEKTQIHQIAGAYFYVFRGAERKKGIYTVKMTNHTRLISADDLTALLDQALEKIRDHLDGILHGDFFLNPFDYKRCKTGKCDFFDLCRIEKTVSIDD